MCKVCDNGRNDCETIVHGVTDQVCNPVVCDTFNRADQCNICT